MDEVREKYSVTKYEAIESDEVNERMFKLIALKPLGHTPGKTDYTWDEIGLADLFADLYKDVARYCVEHKTWYTFYDGKWHKDTDSVYVAEKFKEFKGLLDLFAIGEIKDEEKKAKFQKFLNKLSDRRYRDRVMKDATGTCMVKAAQFDANPYLINCINGTYDLRNYQFRNANSSDLITYQTNFEFDGRKHTCHRWEQFIDEVLEGDKEKIDYLQRSLGYSLLGTAKEECMFILHGKTTRNGKSTLLNAIEHLLGDYADVADTGLISKRSNADPGAANPTLAKLKGKRFVTMSESNKYGALDESAIKQMTGGEPISARALYQAPVTFTPQFKLWLSCNDLPDVSDRSLFASERLRVFEFNRHFTQAEQDKDLKEIFCDSENMKGIFYWLVEGYRKYKRSGLVAPDRLRMADKNYELASDTVLQFLQEVCEPDENFQVKAKDLYDLYKKWCRNYGAKEMSAKWFNAEFLAHPGWYTETKMISGYKTYRGIKVKE